MIWNTILNLFLLATVVVFIIDVSGFKDTVLAVFSRLYKRDIATMRPFTCSLCMTWWIGLIWLLLAGSFDLAGIAALSVVCALTRPLASAFIFIIEALQALIDHLMTKL